MSKKIRWTKRPEDHDYPAAQSYMELLTHSSRAAGLVDDLRTEAMRGPGRTFKAKDILRASELPLLPRGNVHVAGDLEKIKRGEKLSAILLVRDHNIRHPLIIADGYHRVCASYHIDENTDIPCVILSF